MWERLEKREISQRGLRPGPGERPRPDLPEGTDLIPKIKHIVVLMQENHSYDNYLGTLTGRGDGLPAGPHGAPDSVNDRHHPAPRQPHPDLERQSHLLRRRHLRRVRGRRLADRARGRPGRADGLLDGV
jgi:hypothetical protein